MFIFVRYFWSAVYSASLFTGHICWYFCLCTKLYLTVFMALPVIFHVLRTQIGKWSCTCKKQVA